MTSFYNNNISPLDTVLWELFLQFTNYNPKIK